MSTVYSYYGLGLVAQRTQNIWNYPLRDALGSTRQLTDDLAEIVASYQYDPFGVLSAQSSWENGAATSFLFAGEQLEPSGLYYLRARYYDPLTGRFTQIDPVRGIPTSPDTFNPYLYTLNNPVNKTDPSGKMVWIPALILLGGLIRAGVGFLSNLVSTPIDCFKLPEALKDAGYGFLIGGAGSLAYWIVVPMLPTLPAWVTGAIGGFFGGAASTATANILHGKEPWKNIVQGGFFGSAMGVATGVTLPNPVGRPASASWSRGWPLSGYSSGPNSAYKFIGEVVQDIWNWTLANTIVGQP